MLTYLIVNKLLCLIILLEEREELNDVGVLHRTHVSDIPLS
jgi:hypothetical protein